MIRKRSARSLVADSVLQGLCSPGVSRAFFRFSLTASSPHRRPTSRRVWFLQATHPNLPRPFRLSTLALPLRFSLKGILSPTTRMRLRWYSLGIEIEFLVHARLRSVPQAGERLRKRDSRLPRGASHSQARPNFADGENGRARLLKNRPLLDLGGQIFLLDRSNHHV